MVAFFLLAVRTVILALPSETGVTRPVALTVATLGLLLVQVSVVRAVMGFSWATSCRVWPMLSVAFLPWAMLTPLAL